ncbi:unnamed protein product [Oncorhynchus mykiss]|uniref:GAIN-B domain-containing protein n=1 Tax=Oncorhynchus mykiss TaxID=8022 RepID=A0A060W515_ONCMY|nr:unnamed protein product [Oncorhynchus mykiss]
MLIKVMWRLYVKNHFHLCGRKPYQIGARELIRRRSLPSETHSHGYLCSLVATNLGERGNVSILQATGVIIFSLSLANGIIQFVFCPFLFHPQNSVAVAAIHLPLAGTPNPSALQSVDNSTCKLQFIVFRNGKLFPCTGNSSNLADDGKRRSVSTPVAFTKLDGCSIGSAVHSVTIALRHFALGVDPTAAYWDFDLLDGHGGWRAEGCHITGSTGNTTTIHCTHHNNFAVLMVSTEVTLFQSSHRTPFPWLSRGLLLIMNPIHHFAQRSSHVPCQPLRDIRDL